MPFVGTIRVPSDKSISHRAVLFAGLAQGTSRLEAVLPSDDVHATIGAIKALGARVDFEAGPHGLSGEVEGIGKPGTNGQVICPSFDRRCVACPCHLDRSRMSVPLSFRPEPPIGGAVEKSNGEVSRLRFASIEMTT